MKSIVFVNKDSQDECVTEDNHAKIVFANFDIALSASLFLSKIGCTDISTSGHIQYRF